MNKLRRIPSKLRELSKIGQFQLETQVYESPPEWIKRRYLLDWLDATGCGVFVETGTYLGGTARAMASRAKVFTIELDQGLFMAASDRLADLPNVEVFHGDSVAILPRVLAQLEEPALFWLDAHARPGDTEYAKTHTIPTMQEVELALAHKLAPRHIILIDDARFFTGAGGFPSVKALARNVGRISAHEVRVFMDIIHLYPLES